MSSFVISKKEYVKAAGYIAGIAESFNRNGHNDFWLYDTLENKNTDTDLFYKRFVQIYEMNAESVQQQYGDKARETDDNKYLKDFNDYRVKGKGLMFDAKEQQIQAIADVRNFFKSAAYQIENEKYHFIVTHWFNQILDEIANKFIYRFYESDCWGSFDLTSEQETRTA